MFFLFSLMPRSYNIAPHLSIDILYKNYILDLYKMTIGYSVQILKKTTMKPLRAFYAAMRPYKPRSAVFVFRCKIIRQRKVFRYTLFIQFQYSLF